MICVVQNSKLFILPNYNPVFINFSLSTLPCSSRALATLVPPSTFNEVYVFRFHMNQNIQYLPFCARLPFLSTVSSGFIQTATSNRRTGLVPFCGYEQHPIVNTRFIFSIQYLPVTPPIDSKSGLLDYIEVLVSFPDGPSYHFLALIFVPTSIL